MGVAAVSHTSNGIAQHGTHLNEVNDTEISLWKLHDDQWFLQEHMYIYYSMNTV